MILALVQVEKILKQKAEYLLIDGTNVMPIIGYKQRKIKGGDLHHYSISAASVLAKVERDSMMREYAKKYPEYGFDSHVGYGTKKHMDMLNEYGPCDIHRRCFGPVKRFFE